MLTFMEIEVGLGFVAVMTASERSRQNMNNPRLDYNKVGAVNDFRHEISTAIGFILVSALNNSLDQFLNLCFGSAMKLLWHFRSHTRLSLPGLGEMVAVT